MLLPSTGFTWTTFWSKEARFTSGTRMTVPASEPGSIAPISRSTAMIEAYSVPWAPDTIARTGPGRAPCATTTGMLVAASTPAGTSRYPVAACPRSARAVPTAKLWAPAAGASARKAAASRLFLADPLQSCRARRTPSGSRVRRPPRRARRLAVPSLLHDGSPRPHDAVHHRVVRRAVDQEPVAQHPLAYRAGLLGHALAPAVADRAHDLEPDEIGALEGKARGERHRGDRDAAARLGAAHPVAQVAEAVDPVDLVDAARAQEGALLALDHEVIFEAPAGQLLPGPRPRGRLVERVARMAPGEPGKHVAGRLPRRRMKVRCIVGPIGTDADGAHAGGMIRR